MDDSEKLKEVRQITQEWLDQQGHNRCWYYPELFAKLVKTLGLQMTVDPALPPRTEFEEGCKKFQDEQYKNCDKSLNTVVVAIHTVAVATIIGQIGFLFYMLWSWE